MKKASKLFGAMRSIVIIVLIAVIGIAISACNDEITYRIGNTGPGGGKIFYISKEGFKVYTSADYTICHYLEAAPVDQGKFAWASENYTSTHIDGTSFEIGAGSKNTALILATDPAAPAALACKNYNGGGKTDWFLPSRDELIKLYQRKITVSIQTGWYWSSSPYFGKKDEEGNGEDMTWYQGFYLGRQDSYGGETTGVVRAVRAF